MSQEQAKTHESSGESKTSYRGEYRMKPAEIPEGIHLSIADRLGLEAEAFPAREKGSYKGPVIYADSDFIVQAVGKNQQSAVVHRREDVKIVSATLRGRDANNDLENRNIQVHYQGDSANAYPWNPEKEQQARAAHAAAAPDRNIKNVMDAATRYAGENIKNAKQRDAFMKHMDAVTKQAFGQRSPARSEPAPVVQHAELER